MIFIICQVIQKRHFEDIHSSDIDSEDHQIKNFTESSFVEYLHQNDPLPRKYIGEMHKVVIINTLIMYMECHLI